MGWNLDLSSQLKLGTPPLKQGLRLCIEQYHSELFLTLGTPPLKQGLRLKTYA